MGETSILVNPDLGVIGIILFVEGFGAPKTAMEFRVNMIGSLERGGEGVHLFLVYLKIFFFIFIYFKVRNYFRVEILFNAIIV